MLIVENLAAGPGVLLANILAALGGCWWPIEVTPDWSSLCRSWFLPAGRWTLYTS